MRLYENFKPKSSIPLPPDQDSLVAKIKRVHTQRYILLNVFRGTLLSLNIDCYEWKGRGNFNVVPMWFSGNQLLLIYSK